MGRQMVAYVVDVCVTVSLNVTHFIGTGLDGNKSLRLCYCVKTNKENTQHTVQLIRYMMYTQRSINMDQEQDNTLRQTTHPCCRTNK